MTEVVPTVLTTRCGLLGNVAVKWASPAVNTYGKAELGEDVGEDVEAAPNATAAAIQPANSRIPTTIGQRTSLGGV